jgi:hypothetical protein
MIHSGSPQYATDCHPEIFEGCPSFRVRLGSIDKVSQSKQPADSCLQGAA